MRIRGGERALAGDNADDIAMSTLISVFISLITSKNSIRTKTADIFI